MKTFISQEEWLEVPKSEREEIILKFTLHKSAGRDVMGGKLVCDGCSQNDLMSLTIGKMIEMLGDENWEKVPNEELFDNLFARVRAKMSNINIKELKKDDSNKQESKSEPRKSYYKPKAKEANKAGVVRAEESGKAGTTNESNEGKGSSKNEDNSKGA